MIKFTKYHKTKIKRYSDFISNDSSLEDIDHLLEVKPYDEYNATLLLNVDIHKINIEKVDKEY